MSANNLARTIVPVTLCLLLLPCAAVRSEEALRRFIDPQAVAVIRIDVTAIDIDAAMEAMPQPTAGAADARRIFTERAKRILESLREAGTQQVYLVVSLSDPAGAFPRLLLPGVEQWDPAQLKELVPARRLRNYRSEVIDGVWVLASDTAFDGYRTAQKEASHALLKQLPATDDGLVVAVAGTLNTDQRRALAAAEPEWNPVLNRSGARLLDVWQGLSAELRVDTRPEFQLSVFAAADSNRATLRATAEAVAAKLKQLLPGGGESFFAAAEMRLQGESDPPAGSWRLDTNALQKFISQSMAGLDPWLAARLSDGDLSRLREVALAVHNYASAYGHLPAVDLKPSGEPSGLSWRVRLLPFLGKQELWQRFRLDEPWDSPHNRALISEMPAVFRSFRSELPQSEGRANVVAPAGPDTFWVPGRQLQFRDITDGTSNTILLMQVDDALAPIWTQPEPFEVTAENVLERARGFEAGRLPLALGDGWVGVLKTPATAAKLFGFFTRAGGEVTRFEFEQ